MTAEQLWNEIGAMPGSAWVTIYFRGRAEDGTPVSAAGIELYGAGSSTYYIEKPTLTEVLEQVRDCLREHFTHTHKETCRWCAP